MKTRDRLCDAKSEMIRLHGVAFKCASDDNPDAFCDAIDMAAVLALAVLEP